MGLFKRDKTAQQQQQQHQEQQQELLASTQARATTAESTAARLRVELAEQTRSKAYFQMEYLRVEGQLEMIRGQLQTVRGDLETEQRRRQHAESRVADLELRNTLAVSSLEEELGRHRWLVDQLTREKEELRRWCDGAVRVPPPPPPKAGTFGNGTTASANGVQARASTSAVPVSTTVSGNEYALRGARLAARRSVPAFSTLSNRAAGGPGINGSPGITTTTVQAAPAHEIPLRPRSTSNIYNNNSIPTATTAATPSQSDTANNSNSGIMTSIPESSYPAESDTVQEIHVDEEEEKAKEEAKETERRVILESEEMARYEERIRTAETSREQMAVQFTALSGELDALKERLRERETELFVRDNQLEWVQQRAAALARGDADSPFLT